MKTIRSHSAFSFYPEHGIIPAKGETAIDITYIPMAFNTVHSRRACQVNLGAFPRRECGVLPCKQPAYFSLSILTQGHSWGFQSEFEIELNLSSFESKPQRCIISGSCRPGAAFDDRVTELSAELDSSIAGMESTSGVAFAPTPPPKEKRKDGGKKTVKRATVVASEPAVEIDGIVFPQSFRGIADLNVHLPIQTLTAAR